jgi:type VI secretion system protein VasD
MKRSTVALRASLSVGAVLLMLSGCGATLGELGSKMGLGSPAAAPAAPAAAGLPTNVEALKALIPKALEDAARAPQPRSVTVRLHGAERLNVDAAGRSLALVTRIYALSGTEQFQLLTSETLSLDTLPRDHPAQREILAVREVVLPPGRRHEVQLTLPPGASHLAVVGLFHAPSAGRWRFVFSADDAAKTGITLGLHACALSVGAGEPLGTDPELRRLAGVRCPVESTPLQASIASPPSARAVGGPSGPPP